MSAKEIHYSQMARNEIARGVNTLANAVKVTLGPKGRNVIINKSFGSPTVTKDGVTVAKEVELSNKFENMGAQMVKEVASKTSDKAGDGTTTATSTRPSSRSSRTSRSTRSPPRTTRRSHRSAPSRPTATTPSVRSSPPPWRRSARRG
jgi:hypothetical protein